MKKILTLCLLLAACGEKQKPQTVNFSNDTIAGNWYYDSASNTLRVEKHPNYRCFFIGFYLENENDKKVGNFYMIDTVMPSYDSIKRTVLNAANVCNNFKRDECTITSIYEFKDTLEYQKFTAAIPDEKFTLCSKSHYPDLGIKELTITELPAQTRKRMNKLFNTIPAGTITFNTGYRSPMLNDPSLYSTGTTIGNRFVVTIDTVQPDVSTFASLFIGQPKDGFVHAGSNRNRIYIADTVYTKYYMVLLLGPHGYAAYQRCDTCRLVVLDSAATINALFYLLNRQFKTKQ